MDIAAAQLALNRLGRIDRCELLPPEVTSVQSVRKEVQRRLPPGLEAQQPSRRGEQMEKMLQAFHFNLTALSFIALLVGLFLIYNTISVSVISSREEIGVWRDLGVVRTAAVGLFVVDAAVVAVVGAF